MITVVGSVLVDLMAYGNKLPVPGETVTGFKNQITAGGKGANQAAAAARLGAKTYFLGKMSGRDKLVEVLWDGFSRAGVDTSQVGIENDIDCGVGVIHVGENSQNQIIIVLGPNLKVDKAYIDSKYDIIAASKVMLTEFGIPLESAEYATAVARKAGVMTLVNPAPALPMSDAFYQSADVLTPNESEAEILTGIRVVDADSAERAGAVFHEKGVPCVIITMGSMGVFVSDGSKKEFIPSIDCDPVDTTGAGDAFSGGLAYSLAEGNDIFTAANFANIVACISVTRSGTMKSMPTMDEVDEFMKIHRR
jgi:ribokinase